jgi:Uma2 family endonuclease
MFIVMTALLEVPAVRERVHRLTVEEYHRAGATGVLSDDVELLQGIPVTKMPKSPLHELVAGKLMGLLLAQVPKEFTVRRESPLTFGDSEPEPDISLVKGKWDDWVNAHPATAQLVVEVAITSQEIDESKAVIYAEAGIPEYWLVRPEQRSVDVYGKPTGGNYVSKQTLREGDRLRCLSISGVDIAIADILPARS